MDGGQPETPGHQLRGDSCHPALRVGDVRLLGGPCLVQVPARSGALALDQWTQRRSTAQLTSVQLADARDEVVKAYKGIADLRADDPIDLDRQRMLTSSMTAIIGQLNAAAGTVRNITTEPIDAGSHPVGTVIDVRLTIAGDLDHDPATPRVLGLIISPRTTSSFLGYERTARVAEGQVTLRPQFTRHSAVLQAGD